MTSKARRYLRYFGIAVIGATAVGLAEATQVRAGGIITGHPVDWMRSMTSTMPSWYVLAALVPFIIWVAREFPLETISSPKTIAAHVVAAIVFSLVHLFISGWISDYLLVRMSYPIAFAVNFTRLLEMYFVGDFVQYFGIVGVYFAIEYSRRYREKERAASELALKASRLESSLTRANLEALRMQLNPHFLFNTLNTVSVLALKGERQRVARMLSRLSDLLRLSLENDRQAISLREEIEFLERYLEIEQERFRDRLSIAMEIDDAALEASVPSLILQPIVENAVKYGFSQTIGPGSVTVQVHVRSNMLEIEVADTGPGFPPSRAQCAGTGVGLANTRARLEQLYGSNFTLEMSNRPEGGALVKVRLPYIRANSAHSNSHIPGHPYSQDSIAI